MKGNDVVNGCGVGWACDGGVVAGDVGVFVGAVE